MSEKIVLTKYVFESLIKRLVDIEEGKEKIVDFYFPNPSEEREEFAELLDSYHKKLEKIFEEGIDVLEESSIRTLDRNKLKQVNTIPFVIIDSCVDVEDMESSNAVTYKIVNSTTSGSGANELSFFSLSGRSFLLKKAGEEVSLILPDGTSNYRIKCIRLI